MQEGRTYNTGRDVSIRLRQEIHRSDMEQMVEWMSDDRVVKYLNEEQDIENRLQRVLNRSNLPVFSPQLSANGSFYMVTLPGYGAVGFLRLIPKDEGAEIVIVIGDRSRWGEGFGFEAVKKGVRIAFFEWRKEKVIAKIHRENERSKQVFRKAGFTRERVFNGQEKFSVTPDEFV